MSRLRLLVAVPGLPPRSMFLVRRQSAQPVLAEQPMHCRAGDGDLMESPQVIRDPAGAEVILLAQIQDLADHCGWRRHRTAVRHSRPIAQPRVPEAPKAPLPLVVRLA